MYEAPRVGYRTCMRRRITGTLALMTILGVAGCSATASPSAEPSSATASASPSDSASASSDAAQSLANAVAALDQTSFTYQLTAGALTGSGSFDGKARTGQAQFRQTDKSTDVRMIGNDVYLRGVAGVPAGKWSHTNVTATTGDTTYRWVADPAAIAKFLTNTATVTQNGNNYSGTLDLRKAVGGLPGLAALPSTASLTLPFTATTDGTHLTSVTITVPASVGGRSVGFAATMTYASFGTPVSFQRPAAAETVESVR